MKRIKIYKNGDRCEIPQPSLYLIVISRYIEGQWVPSYSEAIDDLSTLSGKLEEISGGTSHLSIIAAPWFQSLAKALELKHIRSEWGIV